MNSLVDVDTEEEKGDRKKKMTVFWVITSSIFAIFLLAEIFWLSNYSKSVSLFEIELKWNWGLATFLTQIIYVLISIRMVGPTELGAKLFFGKPLYELSSGFVFVPFGICQLEKETRLTIQDEIPADPQHIFRKEDVEIVPPGFFPPIRIPFGFKKGIKELEKIKLVTSEGEKELDLTAFPEDDPLDIRVTAEVVPVIRWKIKNFIRFLTTIGSRTEARRQMEDRAISSLTREFAKITPAVALANLGRYSMSLEYEIEKRITGWGIELEDVQVKVINFNRSLNTAIASVPIANLTREKDRLEGEGLGAKEKATLFGRTEGLKQMANELQIHGSAALGAETARVITQNPGQKTIVIGSSGFSELVGIASAIGESFKKEEKKEERK